MYVYIWLSVCLVLTLPSRGRGNNLNKAVMSMHEHVILLIVEERGVCTAALCFQSVHV